MCSPATRWSPSARPTTSMGSCWPMPTSILSVSARQLGLPALPSVPHNAQPVPDVHQADSANSSFVYLSCLSDLRGPSPHLSPIFTTTGQGVWRRGRVLSALTDERASESGLTHPMSLKWRLTLARVCRRPAWWLLSWSLREDGGLGQEGFQEGVECQ